MAFPGVIRVWCAWAAGSARGKARGKQEAPPAKPRPKLEPLSADLMNFFVERRISRAVVERNAVQQERRWSHKRERYVDMIGACLGCFGKPATAVCCASKVLNTLLIARVSVVLPRDVECSTHWVCGLWGTAFPYYRNGELVNVKYRSLDKEFSQVPKAEKVLFGVDDCKGASEIIIVEGEMDKLALEEAGFRHVVSVPDGAPPRLFTYVFQCYIHPSLLSLSSHMPSPCSLSSCMPCSVGFCAELGLLCRLPCGQRG